MSSTHPAPGCSGFEVSSTHPAARIQLEGAVSMVDHFRRISRVLVRVGPPRGLARAPCTSQQAWERGGQGGAGMGRERTGRQRGRTRRGRERQVNVAAVRTRTVAQHCGKPESKSNPRVDRSNTPARPTSPRGRAALTRHGPVLSTTARAANRGAARPRTRPSGHLGPVSWRSDVEKWGKAGVEKGISTRDTRSSQRTVQAGANRS